MQDFVSFAGIIALWLLVSVGLWLAGRQIARRRRGRLSADVARMCELAEEAQSIFDTIRTPAASHPAGDQDATRQATVALLRRIQDQGAFFDNVKAHQQPVRRRLGIAECPPLAEILHIRRDLWAASEIVLAEDLKTLGGAFAEAGSFERFYREAAELLFKSAHDDLIDLRLSMARADAVQFARDVEDDIRAAGEQERLPTPREAVAYPVGFVRAAPAYARGFRAQVMEAAGQVRAAARTVRSSETVAGALSECSRQFWRMREELPGRLSTSLERATTLAQTGRERVSAHYAFLSKAYDLQAKYEEVLRRAPVVTERGRQFIARLELEKRSDQLKETSRGVIARSRVLLVKVLAHLIAGLQGLQEHLSRVEPPRVPGERPPASAIASDSGGQGFDVQRIEPVAKKAGEMAGAGFDVLYRVLRLGPMPQQPEASGKRGAEPGEKAGRSGDRRQGDAGPPTPVETLPVITQPFHHGHAQREIVRRGRRQRCAGPAVSRSQHRQAGQGREAEAAGLTPCSSISSTSCAAPMSP